MANCENCKKLDDCKESGNFASGYCGAYSPIEKTDTEKIKRYPIQYKNKGEYIPFEMMLEHEEQCYKNHGQSVQRLAERCGTSYLETYYILNDSPFKRSQQGEYERLEYNARRIVHALVYEWLMQNNKLN